MEINQEESKLRDTYIAVELESKKFGGCSPSSVSLLSWKQRNSRKRLKRGEFKEMLKGKRKGSKDKKKKSPWNLWEGNKQLFHK